MRSVYFALMGRRWLVKGTMPNQLENRVEGLSDADKSNIQEVFGIIAGSSINLDFHQLKCAMIALNFDPTNLEVQEVMQKYDQQIGWPQFEYEMAIMIKNRDQREELEKAFNLVAENGKISLQKLKSIAGEQIEVDHDISLNEFMDICS